MLEIMFLDSGGDLFSVVGVGVDGVDEVHARRIVAADLVSGPGPEFEDFALGGLDKRGDYSGVFKINKSIGCARELVSI